MSDERVRELERIFAESESASDEAAWLRARVRVGEHLDWESYSRLHELDQGTSCDYLRSLTRGLGAHWRVRSPLEGQRTLLQLGKRGLMPTTVAVLDRQLDTDDVALRQRVDDLFMEVHFPTPLPAYVEAGAAEAGVTVEEFIEEERALVWRLQEQEVLRWQEAAVSFARILNYVWAWSDSGFVEAHLQTTGGLPAVEALVARLLPD